MTVEEAIFSILSDDPDVSSVVTSIVDSVTKKRIHPGNLPQGVTYPAIAYRAVSGEHYDYLEGSLGLKRSRFRIFCANRKEQGGYPVAKRLDEYVRLALHGFAGTIVSDTSPTDTVIIQNIRAMNHQDLYHDQSETYQVASDYDVYVEEPIP